MVVIAMKETEYALYKGEVLLEIGTLDEIAKARGVSRKTIYHYSTPAHINQMERRHCKKLHELRAERVKRGVYKVFNGNKLIGEGNLKQLAEQTGIGLERLKNLFYGEPPKMRKKNYQVVVRLEE